MDSGGQCPICARQCRIRRVQIAGEDGIEASCMVCGEYAMTWRAKSSLATSGALTRRKLERYLGETPAEPRLLLTAGKALADKWAGRVLSISEARKLYDDDGSPLQKYQNAVRRIAQASSGFGATFNTSKHRWLIPTMDDSEAKSIVSGLMREGHLAGIVGASGTDFSLTLKGHEYALTLASEAASEPVTSKGAIPVLQAADVARAPMNDAMADKTIPTKVFVVHGRDANARDAMFDFLRSIGLQPIEWSEAVMATGKPAPYVGEILDAAFGSARAVVVLMTPDDEAQLREEFWASDDEHYERELTGQARPNVLFEAGMAMGRSPDRTVLVTLGNLRHFSDIGGRLVVRMGNSIAARQSLAQRLQAAGCAVNLAGTRWHTAGRFTTRRSRAEKSGRESAASSESDTAAEPFKAALLGDPVLSRIEEHYKDAGYEPVWPLLAEKDVKLASGYEIAYYPGTRREIWAGFRQGRYELILMLRPRA